jgi:hypothetical protein
MDVLLHDDRAFPISAFKSLDWWDMKPNFNFYSSQYSKFLQPRMVYTFLTILVLLKRAYWSIRYRHLPETPPFAGVCQLNFHYNCR